jgi:hypothetical protein
MALLKDGTMPRIGQRVRCQRYEGIVSAVASDNSIQRGQIAVAVLKLAEPDYTGLSLLLRPHGPRLVVETEYGAASEFERMA